MVKLRETPRGPCLSSSPGERMDGCGSVSAPRSRPHLRLLLAAGGSLRRELDPRTFLPPRSSPPAGPVPQVGDPAPTGTLGLDAHASVIAFMRHVGCPFAEATFRALRTAAAAHPELRFVAVSHAAE